MFRLGGKVGWTLGVGQERQNRTQSENSDSVRVEIFIERLPVQFITVGTAPNQRQVHVHTITARTTVQTGITIQVAGYTTPPDNDFLLLIGQEIVRAARSR